MAADISRRESGPADPTSGPGPASVDLLLFAAAREAAGTPRVRIRADTVADALDQARSRFDARFGAVLDGSRVWLNGEPAAGPEVLSDGDEVAVLPPVSGG